jgi:HEAT repeat protein
MDVSPDRFPNGVGASEFASVADSRLQPTCDYGTLGPGSDLNPETLNAGHDQDSSCAAAQNRRGAAIASIVIGVLLAVITRSISTGHTDWARFIVNDAPSVRTKTNALRSDLRQIDSMKPQRQAEILLGQAVGNSGGAVQQISTRVDRWRGQLQWTPQMANLFTAALNSDDRQVRASAIEVELATYNLTKNETSLNYLLQSAESSNHAQRIWALWALGLVGNRGIGTEQVVQVLTAHVQNKDEDEDSRRWAVEALAVVGSTRIIPVLLDAMHNDPSPVIRERAACALAEAGMFTHEQRMTAVPQLINYTDDSALDAQTHGWAFQALNDITHQHLPNDSAVWRSWYESTQKN